MSNSSIWPIDRTLSSTTSPGQSGPGSEDNEGVFHVPQSSRIIGASPFWLYSVISKTLVGEVLSLCRDADGVFYSPQPTGPFYLIGILDIITAY